MLELGQPTHAFDSDKLKGEIVVRLAREGEKFLALDGKTYNLNSQDLVIADQERVVGIGGVMGGEDTGVTATTKNVLLEAAYFRPGSVRRTARRLSLPSDASYRFERGVDPAMILPASQRATELISEHRGREIPRPEIATAGELPAPPPDVSLRYERCDATHRRAGSKASASIKFSTDSVWRRGTADDVKLRGAFPAFASDLQREADLIEEVVRVFGIERVPVPVSKPLHSGVGGGPRPRF